MAETLAGFYDIVVIGAGPAGSTAARAAACGGAKVLLIDKRQRIGVPVQCAEFVPRWIFRHASFTSQPVTQTIETMLTHLPDGSSHEMRSPGYMLDRSLFDKELAASAILSGARISTGAQALECSSDGVLVERGTEREWVRSKVIIGADGVHSTVARSVGQSSSKVIVALQYEVVMFQPQTHVDIFFHPDYEGGYAWFFPKGKTANVGLGVVPSKTSLLTNLLNNLLNSLNRFGKLPRIEIVSKTGGTIPCEPYQQTVFGNILFTGDAAGHAHPITGAGILNAVMGGEIAGRIAAEAVARKDLRYLENYETKWREIFGKPLSYGAYKRQFLEEHWNKSGVDFQNLIRRTWVGFKEYHEDRRKVNAQG